MKTTLKFLTGKSLMLSLLATASIVQTKVKKTSMRQIFIASIFILLNAPIGLADNTTLTGNATVILAFDDGWVNAYDTVKPILDSNGQKAVVFAITEPVVGGWSDYMTIDQLKTLYNDGWDISSHSYTHGSAHPNDYNYLIEANNSELKHELGDSKDWLDTNRFTRSSMFFAYPYGAYDDNLTASVKASGYYVAARTTDEYLWRYSDTHPHYKIGDADVLKMATLPIDNNSIYPLPEVLNEINKTISESGLLIITFHKIVTGTPANAEEYNRDDFIKISAYLKNTSLSGNVKVTTFSEYFKVPSPIPTYMPSTPLNGTPIIGEDWIYVPWSDGTGNKTDVFDVLVNNNRIYNVVNRYINFTGLAPGSPVSIEVYAINRSWGWTTKNNSPLVINAAIPVTVKTDTPSTPAISSSSGSSGGSSGGGGGIIYDNNAASYERIDSQFYNGTVSRMIFTKNGLISEVTVKGIKNYGEITAVVSLLKKNPTNITVGNVYKFFSVNMGTIRHENERLFFKDPTVTMLLSKANISDKAVKVYRFTNGSWVAVDMEELTGTDENRHFKLKLDGFSDFAVVLEPKTTAGVASARVSESSTPAMTQTGTEPETASGASLYERIWSAVKNFLMRIFGGILPF